MNPRWLLAMIVIALMATAGCSSSPPSDDDSPAYTPVPDPDLFAQVDQLAGVTGSAITFNDTFPENGYFGEVEIAPDADPQQVLDTVYAVLRQGAPDASIMVEGIQGNRVNTFDRLPGSGVGTPVNLAERYGPQPGDGAPPAS